MADVSEIVEAFHSGLNKTQIADKLGVSFNTVLVYLRREGLAPQKDDVVSRNVVRAYSDGMTQGEIAEHFRLGQPDVSRILVSRGLSGPRAHPDAKSLEERVRFMNEHGLDNVGGEGFGITRVLTDIETMRGSYDFFVGLGADPKRIYNAYPSLITHRPDTLRPKMDFLVDEIGLPVKKIARKPDLFTYSLDCLRATFEHYARLLGDSNVARRMLRAVPSVFGNNVQTIDRKIRVYNETGIDFHLNYTLLEKSPEKVIDTMLYLRDDLKISEPETNKKGYYMLLSIDRETLKRKVDYCNADGIKWKNHPTILIMGLGTGDNPGALVRRPELIKSAFVGTALPYQLDYRNRPRILEASDEVLKERIGKYS